MNMKEIKEELISIREKVKPLKNYSDDIANDYVKDIQRAIELLTGIDAGHNKELSECKIKSLKELKVEVKDRFDSHFFTMNDHKKRNELGYSRLIVLTSLKRVIDCL
jgi:hypothetical protein